MSDSEVCAQSASGHRVLWAALVACELWLAADWRRDWGRRQILASRHPITDWGVKLPISVALSRTVNG
eukprot:7376507-Prymnesium_polylepis.3